jgi:lipopolysaccharide/colanic/teichoic acid biosynthesis glycosyltransferase
MFRLFDLFWSILGLLCLSPLLALVGLVIKLADGGPVLFLQERVGWNGVPFRIVKFRTMSAGPPGHDLSITVGGDPRITPVGHWIRKWKLDELPQLVNVVRGEMALVGPRPEVPQVVALFTPEQRQVLRLRPGITGAASIAYRCQCEAFSRVQDLSAFYMQNVIPNKIRLNLEYAAQATLWSDFKLILATLFLLPPPVPVRPAGDLRAFDRVPLRMRVNLLSDGLPMAVGRPVNICPGGILLKPDCQLPVGCPCELAFSQEDTGQPPVSTRGTVLRSDEQGIVIRFQWTLQGAALARLSKIPVNLGEPNLSE